MVLGHEAAGVVEAVGEDVTYVKPGDHVITCLSVFCGECPQCMTGHPNLCENTEVKLMPGAARRLRWKGEVLNQAFNLSAFAEQMLVHEHAVVKIGDDIPLDRAALVGCGVMTGVGAVFHAAKVEPGSTVAVIGCGGIGLSAVNGAALAGAARIIAIDTVPSKLELAKKMGATDTINASNADPVEAVREMTGGGVAYSFEAIGTKATAEQSFAMLRPGWDGDDHRHDPVRHEDRVARGGFPAGPENPGHINGRQSLPGGYAAAAGSLGAGPVEARPPDFRPYPVGRYQRGLCEAEVRRAGAAVDRLRSRVSRRVRAG